MMKQTSDLFEQAAPKRQEKTLREFKEVLQHLIYLLRSAVKADTAYLYWINRSRQQFVKEAQSTGVKNMRFEDRVSFKNHFLNEYKNIDEPVMLKAGRDINMNDSGNGEKDLARMLLIPFINNEETVSLTGLEWREENRKDQAKVIQTYTATLGKLLNTYLEITDLYQRQHQWDDYEERLNGLAASGHPVALLDEAIQTLQSFLGEGSVSLIAKGMGSLCNVLNSNSVGKPLPIGMPVERQTLTADALKGGSSEFSVHFNGNPKRVSSREENTEGASLAIPLIVNKLRVGAVLVHDENPLMFKESTKHKLKNIVRLTGLKIQSYLNNKKHDRRIFTNECGALVADIWERIIGSELRRLKENRDLYFTWAGFATLQELSKIRTQFRAEDIKCLQKDLIRVLNPGSWGVPGVVGFHTDHRYLIVIQSSDKAALERWQEKINEKFDQPFALSNGLEIQSKIQTGFIRLNESCEDSYEVVQRCKAKLNKR